MKKATNTTKTKANSSGKGRPVGIPKTGGRKKGTPNKMTSSLRKQLEEQLAPFIENLGHMLMMIDEPKDRIAAMAQLMPYICPKLQSIDMKAEEERSITVEQYLVSLDQKYSEKKAELTAKKVKLVNFD